MSGRTTSAPARPIRMCVGCRKRADQAQLIRFVAVGGRCVPDPRSGMPGRGAYVHPRTACLDLAERRRAAPRALRVSGPLDLTELRVVIGAAEAHALSEALKAGRES